MSSAADRFEVFKFIVGYQDNGYGYELVVRHPTDDGEETKKIFLSSALAEDQLLDWALDACLQRGYLFDVRRIKDLEAAIRASIRNGGIPCLDTK